MSRYTSKHTGSEIDAAVDRANGYGLGGGAKFITSGSLNDYKDCGWYAWDEGVSNVPFAYGSCIILNKGSSWIAHQIAIAGYGQNICIRRYVNQTDSWDAWEWVNPPMQLGVEYRTTERFFGLPVYVKVIDIGSLPNKTMKSISNYAENVKYVIDFDGFSYYYGQSLRNPDFARMYARSTFITVETFSDLSSGTAIMWVKYTKTTD